MAHTLTFTSNVTVTVNDVLITSPYTLQNGDTIVVEWDSTNLLGARPVVNGNMYEDGDTLNIQDTNIEIDLQVGGGSN